MLLRRLAEDNQFRQHRCKFLNSNKKHATCCLSSGYVENRSQWHVTLHFFLGQHPIVANRRRKSFSVTSALISQSFATCKCCGRPLRTYFTKLANCSLKACGVLRFLWHVPDKFPIVLTLIRRTVEIISFIHHGQERNLEFGGLSPQAPTCLQPCSFIYS